MLLIKLTINQRIVRIENPIFDCGKFAELHMSDAYLSWRIVTGCFAQNLHRCWKFRLFIHRRLKRKPDLCSGCAKCVIRFCVRRRKREIFWKTGINAGTTDVFVREIWWGFAIRRLFFGRMNVNIKVLWNESAVRIVFFVCAKVLCKFTQRRNKSIQGYCPL